MARSNPTAHRYGLDERPPLLTALGLGTQGALLNVPPVVLFPLIAVQIAGGSSALADWLVFISLAATGATMVLQTMRVGIVGSGCHLSSVSSSVSIPFCALALVEGGPKTLAALVFFGGLFGLGVALRLSVLRRIFNPTVTGTISILLVITIISVVLEKVSDVPDGRVNAAGLLCGAITLISTLAFLLRKPGFWRVWGPLFGLALGCIAGAALGVLNLESLRHALWFGVPLAGWEGPGYQFGAAFWTLAPAFLFISALTVVQTNSLSFVAHRVSLPGNRAVDFRAVQGGVVGNTVGNMLAGLAGSMPIMTSPRGSMFVQQTGCASRDVGILIGVMLVALAFFPKAWALLLVIPVPVMAAYLIVVLAPMFVEGMRAIIQAEPDYSKSLVVGTSIAIGLAFQYQLIDLPIGALWESTLQKAITSGGISVILLTLALEAMGPRRRRLRVPLGTDELPRINQFLEQFSRRNAWNDQTTARLQAVAEETLLVLVDREDSGRGRRLRITAASSGRGAELEFITAPTEAGNLEDQFAMLGDPPPEVEGMLAGGDMSMRVLRHLATSVSHRQYQETEVITVQVAVESER